ncbi:hypothetical protein BC831DRAFT_510597 [Entophlyctis helioformis]|nr:hypothetical protein BC831DRAFT_510597 [Entophlyctis helioformis]
MNFLDEDAGLPFGENALNEFWYSTTDAAQRALQSSTSHNTGPANLPTDEVEGYVNRMVISQLQQQLQQQRQQLQQHNINLRQQLNYFQLPFAQPPLLVGNQAPVYFTPSHNSLSAEDVLRRRREAGRAAARKYRERKKIATVLADMSSMSSSAQTASPSHVDSTPSTPRLPSIAHLNLDRYATPTRDFGSPPTRTPDMAAESPAPTTVMQRLAVLESEILSAKAIIHAQLDKLQRLEAESKEIRELLMPKLDHHFNSSTAAPSPLGATSRLHTRLRGD